MEVRVKIYIKASVQPHKNTKQACVQPHKNTPALCAFDTITKYFLRKITLPLEICKILEVLILSLGRFCSKQHQWRVLIKLKKRKANLKSAK